MSLIHFHHKFGGNLELTVTFWSFFSIHHEFTLPKYLQNNKITILSDSWTLKTYYQTSKSIFQHIQSQSYGDISLFGTQGRPSWILKKPSQLHLSTQPNFHLDIKFYQKMQKNDCCKTLQGSSKKVASATGLYVRMCASMLCSWRGLPVCHGLCHTQSFSIE